MTKRRVFLILAALWLCFIWGQSFLSADLSRAALTGTLFAAMLAAVTDETIQLFSAGRSGQITDVWLDFAGAALGYLAVRLLTHRKE